MPAESCLCEALRLDLCDPSKAAELRGNGITPEMAAEHYGYDEDDFPLTLWEAYCVGEMEEVPQDLFDL